MQESRGKKVNATVEKIYHYTSLSSFVNILKDTQKHDYITFWASGIAVMNDPGEILYGIKKTKDFLVTWENEKSISEEVKLSTYINDKDCKENCGLSDFYAVSFSENKDNLPMWTSYGDNGRGINIEVCDIDYEIKAKSEKWHGFDIYTDIQVNIKDGIRASDMEYGDIGTQKDSICKKLIVKQYEDFLKLVEGRSSEIDTYRQKAVEMIKAFGAMLVKGKAYEYEHEKRVYGLSNGKRYYRMNKKGTLIPYVTVKVPKRLITGITLGPAFEKVNKLPLMQLLENVGLGNIKPSTSLILYRNI